MPSGRYARRPMKGAASIDPESTTPSRDDSRPTTFSGSSGHPFSQHQPTLLSCNGRAALAPGLSLRELPMLVFLANQCPLGSAPLSVGRTRTPAPLLSALPAATAPSYGIAGLGWHPPAAPPAVPLAAACPRLGCLALWHVDNAMHGRGAARLVPVVVRLHVEFSLRVRWVGTGRKVNEEGALACRGAWRDWVPDAHVADVVVVVKLIPSV
jgi:hypothetical protein